MLKTPQDLKIATLKADFVETDKDSLSVSKEKWQKDLKKDVYLFEAVKIMNDLI